MRLVQKPKTKSQEKLELEKILNIINQENKNLSDLQSAITKSIENLKEKEVQIEAKNNEIKQLELRNIELKEKYGKEGKEIEQLIVSNRIELENYKKEVFDQKDKAEFILLEIKSLLKEKEDISSLILSLDNGFKKKREELANQISILTETINTFNRDISLKEKELQSLNSQIDKLVEDVAAKEQQAKKLELDQEGLNKKIEDLNKVLLEKEEIKKVKNSELLEITNKIDVSKKELEDINGKIEIQQEKLLSLVRREQKITLKEEEIKEVYKKVGLVF